MVQYNTLFSAVPALGFTICTLLSFASFAAAAAAEADDSSDNGGMLTSIKVAIGVVLGKLSCILSHDVRLYPLHGLFP